MEAEYKRIVEEALDPNRSKYIDIICHDGAAGLIVIRRQLSMALGTGYQYESSTHSQPSPVFLRPKKQDDGMTLDVHVEGANDCPPRLQAIALSAILADAADLL